MLSTRRRALSTTVLAVATALACGWSITPAAAQAWPEKTITFVNPFPAGGGTDVFARPLAAELTKQLGKTVIIDTRGGAGGTLGAGIAAKAAKDGYTFFVGAVHHTIAPAIYSSLTYDLEKDFAPVAVVAMVPQVIVVHPERVKAKTLAELIAFARANPGKLNYASAGNGTAHHLAGELFKIAQKVVLNHIPYKGAGPAMQDLLAGQVDMMFDGLGTSAAQIKGNRLRPLVVASEARSPAIPDVPSAKEAGMPDYLVSTWYGVWAVAGTPKEIIDRMQAEIAKALAVDQLKALWAQQGAVVGPATPATMATFVRGEIEKWGKVAKAANVKID
jgi:tripartite-type tricarboxylate transporter receptor subunit TctC